MSAGPKDPGAFAGEGFLSRWSRRKRLDEADAQPPVAAPVGQADGQSPDEPADERPRCPETGEVIDAEHVASLPRIEDIKPGDDLSGFMRRGVPEALRRQALRTMWTTDPVIRDYVSPALDYAHDYNTPGAVVGFEPLSESELESARAMVGRMFSTPQELARAPIEPPAQSPTAEASKVEAGEAAGTDSGAGRSQPDQIVSMTDRDIGSDLGSDMESQPEAGRNPSAIRLSDAAAQQAGAAVSGRVGQGDVSLSGDRRAQTGVLPDLAHQAGSPVVLQRSADGPSGDLPLAGRGAAQPASGARRRRGGGATPV
jgi:hypothetical protein